MSNPGLCLGVTVTNPATGAVLPVFAAPYVLSDFGNGAVMGTFCLPNTIPSNVNQVITVYRLSFFSFFFFLLKKGVPAHDARDWAFAQHHDLPIKVYLGSLFFFFLKA